MDNTKENNMQKVRNSNLELLRIIAMIMIVAHHFAYHSGVGFPSSTVTFNRVWMQLLSLGGKLGVDIFVLISGYFLINSKLTISKVIKLLLEMLTFSISIYLIFLCTHQIQFDYKELLKALFPFFYNQFWFGRMYLLMYLLSPLMNAGLKNISQKTHKNLLIIFFIFWVFCQTYLKQRFEVSLLLWFLYLYSVAAYFRLYPTKLKHPVLIFASSFLFTYLLNFSLVIANDYLAINKHIAGEYLKGYYGEMSMPIFLSALFIFLAFANMKPRTYNFINIIGASTFGVYLFHEQPLMRTYLWKTVFKMTGEISKTPYYFIYSILVVLTVFLVGILLDLIRRFALELWYMKVINNISQSKENKSVIS